MQNILSIGLKKIVNALETEKIDYMIVGGFAVSYHNRARTTNDIDIVLQIYPHHVPHILKYFPQWEGFEESFKSDVASGMMFNITDFEIGIRYDFMVFQNTDYSWAAFKRRVRVDFLEVECFMSSKEDLIISKLKWYNISPSEKQMEDLKFLVLDQNLDMEYIRIWVQKLNLKTHGDLLG